MPSKPTFLRWWKRLEERFGPQRGVDAYYLYLHRVLPEDTEFEGAAGAVWATARFFPRPADFLLAGGADAWETVRSNALKMVGGDVRPEQWKQLRAGINDRAWAALQSLGGPAALRSTTDVVRFRREFLHAFELVITKEAHQQLPALPPAQRQE